MILYVKLFFGGFAVGLIPAITFYLLVGAYRSVVECAELAAN